MTTKKLPFGGQTYQHESERRREEAAQDQAGRPPKHRPDQPPSRHRSDLIPRGHGAAVLFSPQLLQLDLGLKACGTCVVVSVHGGVRPAVVELPP